MAGQNNTTQGRQGGSIVARSTEHTLLAKMGFCDPDAKNPRHKLACQFLAQPSIAAALLPQFFCNGKKPIEVRQYSWEPYKPWVEDGKAMYKCWKYCGSQIEYHLQKGSGSYATTIGFIDLAIGFALINEREDRLDPLVWPYQDHPRSLGLSERLICIEVKINESPADEILKQINLYKSYAVAPASGNAESSRWILATDYDLSSRDSRMFLDHKIKLVRLGNAFEEWIKSRPEDHCPVEVIQF